MGFVHFSETMKILERRIQFSKIALTSDEFTSENNFRETTSRLSNGRYCV